jgi:hypothetical protein
MLGAVDANIAHVADVEKADRAANGFMFGDETAAGGVLNRHVPATKIHHFGAQTAMQRV